MSLEFNYKPFGYRVLVKQYQYRNEHKVEGTDKKIILSSDTDSVEMNQLAESMGEVIAMGDQCYKHARYGYSGQDDWEPPIKVGDFVYFKQYHNDVRRQGSDKHMKPTGDYLLTINDDDIFGHAAITEVEDGNA